MSSERTSIQVVIPSTRPDRVLTVLSELVHHKLDRSPIIVDDTRDGSVFQSIGSSGIQVLRSHGAGPGAARNMGAKSASSEWLLFLDDDVVLPADFGTAVRQTLKTVSDDVAVVECAVMPVGTARRPYWRDRVVDNTNPGAFMMASMLVRRESFSRVGGGMAVSQGDHREDADVALRIIASGARAIWSQEIFVFHPVERVDFRRFLRTAAFFRHDAIFNRRHPGYLGQTGRRIDLGSLRLRGGFRRRLPLLAMAVALPALVTGRRSLALAMPVILGIGLNLVHLQSLRRVGARPPVIALLDPTEIMPHAVWGMVLAAARFLGEVECVLHPWGSWRRSRI